MSDLTQTTSKALLKKAKEYADMSNSFLVYVPTGKWMWVLPLLRKLGVIEIQFRPPMRKDMKVIFKTNQPKEDEK